MVRCTGSASASESRHGEREREQGTAWMSERLSCGDGGYPQSAASGAAVAPCAWAARPTESHLSHLIPLNPAESRPRNGFHAIPPPPVPLPTGSFPSTAGARVYRARSRATLACLRAAARSRALRAASQPRRAEVGDRAANARRSFFASGGRRGDADGRSLLSLSAPGGGEGRGEVGALASVLRSGEDAPCPAAEAR